MDKVQKRKSDLDVMRIIAIIGVIMIHSLGRYSDVKVISVIGRYVTYAVPLLVMISGAVWLGIDREISIKKIWKKNIFHIVMAFSFWSVLYACVNYKELGNVKDFVWRCIIGNYHLWYCYMIVGIYILLPIIKQIKKSNELYNYFIILVLCCSIILPTIAEFPMTSSIQHVLDLINISIGNEYLFYFLMGNILYERVFSRKVAFIIYSWGILSIVLIYMQRFNSGDYSFARMGYTVFIFYSIMSLWNKFKGLVKIEFVLQKIAEMCFGIYLVHDIFLKIYNECVLNDYTSPYCMVFGKVIFCFGASYFTVVLIKKIPIIGKYIV